MPAKEIKELRQSGQLEAALKMASEELMAQPDNIWGKRNISWVYYAYIKQYVLEFNFEGFLEFILKVKELNLPKEENMLFDSLTWQISSMLFKLNKATSLDYSKINKIFDAIKEFYFTKPSEGYSLLYKSFHKGYKNWSRYLEFADWWNLDNLRQEDYLKETYNHREIMALAEQAYIAYAKTLLNGEALDEFGNQRKIDVQKINEFLPKLNQLISKYKDYQYPIYFKVKLLLVTEGDGDEILKSFLPFAKMKKNDFWVWELLAEIYKNNQKNKKACLCKALSLKTKEDFIINTHQSLATLLIENKEYNEAKTEIRAIIKTREKNKWRIPNLITSWMNQSWYKEAKEYTNNSKLYKSFVTDAEELLFNDKDEIDVMVEFVNSDKKIISFVNSKEVFGFFNYRAFHINPKVGDVYRVRMEAEGNEGYYKVFTLKNQKSNFKIGANVLKDIFGTINIPTDKNFGFINDVFVSPDLINRNKIINGDKVNGKAMQSYNKKIKEWGWKVFKIEQ